MKRTEKYFQNRTRYFWRDNYIQMRIDHRSRSMYRRFSIKISTFWRATDFWKERIFGMEHT